MKQLVVDMKRFKMTDRNIILKLVADSGLSLADGKLSVNENVLDKLCGNLTAENKRIRTAEMQALATAVPHRVLR